MTFFGRLRFDWVAGNTAILPKNYFALDLQFGWVGCLVKGIGYRRPHALCACGRQWGGQGSGNHLLRSLPFQLPHLAFALRLDRCSIWNRRALATGRDLMTFQPSGRLRTEYIATNCKPVPSLKSDFFWALLMLSGRSHHLWQVLACQRSTIDPCRRSFPVGSGRPSFFLWLRAILPCCSDLPACRRLGDEIPMPNGLGLLSLPRDSDHPVFEYSSTPPLLKLAKHWVFTRSCLCHEAWSRSGYA